MTHQVVTRNLIRDNILGNLDVQSVLRMMLCCRGWKKNLEMMFEGTYKKEKDGYIIQIFLDWERTWKKNKDEMMLCSDKIVDKEVIYGNKVWLEKEMMVSKKRMRVHIPKMETISKKGKTIPFSLTRFSDSIEIDGVRVTLLDRKVEEVMVKTKSPSILIVIFLPRLEVKINVYRKGELRNFVFNQTNFHRPMVKSKFEKMIEYFGVSRFFSYEGEPRLTDTFFSRFGI
jgi:hypothetical protein